ncbi:PIK3R4 [Bugula neritina]|uniref:PIK3R4 n=1 Tax=Bugula neritina TaxID=10212 RepID=A0A7J7KFU3_BUGNE|nr:PIK3R4 [Bugula neritina]
MPIPGSIDISLIKIQRRHADLIPPQDVVQSRTTAKPKSIQLPEPVQTPDVRALFTGTDVLDSPTSPPQAPPPKPEVRSLTHQPSTERLVDVPDKGGNPTQRPGRAGTQYNTVKQSRCKLDLRTLVHHKRDEYADDYRNRASLVTNLAATEEGVVFPSEWKPRGILVAHSHEHKDSVTRLLVHPTNQFFMTASKDGTVKLWDTYKPDLKTSNMSKSRSTYQGKQGGKIMDMVFCTLDYWIACLTSKDSINLINIETGDQTGTLYHEKATLSCDTNNCGHIVAISPSEYGRRTVINYATVNGHIIGWDLRANRTIFTLKHSLDKGLVTSMTSHLDEKWVAVGTSQGSITLYDMRFQLPVNSIIHGSDTGRRVNHLSSHPAESSWVVGAMAGHNELSIWNLETKQRQKMLWASSSPVFARESNRMWVNGFHVHQSSSQSFVITAGSDRNIRFWDLNQPANSALVVVGTADKVDTKVYRYKSSVVDGTDCIVESSEEVNRSTTEMGERVIRAKPQPGHHNAITDLGFTTLRTPLLCLHPPLASSKCGNSTP